MSENRGRRKVLNLARLEHEFEYGALYAAVRSHGRVHWHQISHIRDIMLCPGDTPNQKIMRHYDITVFGKNKFRPLAQWEKARATSELEKAQEITGSHCDAQFVRLSEELGVPSRTLQQYARHAKSRVIG